MADDKEVVIRISAKNLTSEEFAKARKEIAGITKDTEDSSNKTKGLGGALQAWAKENKASLTAVGQAIGLVGGLVGGLAAGIVALGARGSDVADIREGFDQMAEASGLASDVLLNKLSKSVDGVISRTTLMKSASAAMSQGLRLDSDQWALTGEAARVYADRVGVSVPEAFDTLTKAMATGRDMMLKGIGANIDGKKALDDYARSIGKESADLTENEQAIAKRNAILKMMREEVERTGGVELDFADRLTLVKTGLENFMDAVGEGIADSPVLASIMTSIGDAMGEAFGDNQADLIRTIIKWVNQAAIYLIDFAQVGVSTAKFLSNAFYGMRAIFGGVATGILGLIEYIGKGLRALIEFGSKLPIVGDQFKAFAHSQDDYIDFLEGARKGMQAWAGESLDSAASIGKGLDDVNGFLEKVKTKAIAAGQASAEAEPKVKKHAAALGGLGAAADAASKAQDALDKKTRELADALELAEKKHVSSTAIIDQFGKAAYELVRASGDAADKLPAIIRRTDDAFRKSEIAKIIADGMAVGAAAFEKYLAQMHKDLEESVDRSNKAFLANIDIEQQALDEANDLEAKRSLSAYDYQVYLIQKKAGQDKAALNTHASNYAETLNTIERATAAKMQEAADDHAEAMAKMNAATNAWGNLTKKWLGSVPGLLQAAFTGGGGLEGAIKASAAGIGGDIGEKLFAGPTGLGAKLAQGLFQKGMGANASSAFGSLLGTLGGPLGSMLTTFGIGLGKKLFSALFGSAGRDEVKKFADSFGGFDDLHTKLLSLGAAGEALWVKLTQGVGKNNPAQAKAVIEEINAAFADQGDKAERLASAMEKYGITWEDLGEKARQAHVDQVAKGLIEDFDVLNDAGIDVDTIIQKMGSSIQDLVNSARKTGAEVPLAMKPMLQRMIELGLLTDENGNKLEDLSSINFSESLTQGFDRIVDAINRVAKALGADLPDAIAKIPKDVQINVKTKYTHEGDDGGDGEQPEPEHYATGGIASGAQIARVAERGKKEIIGDVEFMTQALAGALGKVSQPGRSSAAAFIPTGQGAGVRTLELVLPIGRQVERYSIDLEKERRRQGQPTERRTLTERSF